MTEINDIINALDTAEYNIRNELHNIRYMLYNIPNNTQDIEDGFYRVRECSICGTPVGYLIEKGHSFFASDCSCTSYDTPPRPCDIQQVRDFLKGKENDK